MVLVTIDTQKDSPEDIKKAIVFIESMLPGSSSAPAPLASMDLFSEPETKTTPIMHEEPSAKPSSKGFFDLFSGVEVTQKPERPKKKDDDGDGTSFIEIVEY